MTNEQLGRVWEVINRAIDDRFGKTLVVGIPIEEKRDFAERVVKREGRLASSPRRRVLCLKLRRTCKGCDA